MRLPFFLSARWLSVLFLGVSLALLAGVPLAQGAGIRPPDIIASLTGAQTADRIAYSLEMTNTGDLAAVNVQILAVLPAGLTLEDGTQTLTVVLPSLNSGQRIQLGFVAIIDATVAPGTVATVTAQITYGAPGGLEIYEKTASLQMSVAPRGGAASMSTIALVGAIAGVFLVLLGFAWKVHGQGVRIDQLFLLHDSGMLIRHYSNGKGLQKDSDIMSGMLIVLQEFVRDSFNDQRSSLEEVRFGEKRVLMARGKHSIMAAVVTGKRLNGLPVRLQRALGEFEGAHGADLRGWNGNLETLDSADAAFRSVLSPRYGRFPPT